MIETLTNGGIQLKRWIALLGLRDTPTDGIEDHCIYLGRALEARGIELQRVRVPWMELRWIGALRDLSRRSTAWCGQWVLLEYTSLAWSKRGFPLGALAVSSILRLRGARVAIVFHESNRQGGSRLIDRVRGACQDWVIHGLYRHASEAIFTVPLETVKWLPKGEDKATFIPIGPNIPEHVNHRPVPDSVDKEKTVIVFGVTGAPQADQEVEEIAAVVREASDLIPKMRLLVIGRGGVEARDLLTKALEKCGVDLIVRGILPAEEVTREFGSADALLFIRGPVSLQRSSAMAGIACGLPIVGYRNGDISGPLKEAGVEWATWRDRDSLVRGLVRVLSDPLRWTELHERNLTVQKKYFSWNEVAKRYQKVLAD